MKLSTPALRWEIPQLGGRQPLLWTLASGSLRQPAGAKGKKLPGLQGCVQASSAASEYARRFPALATLSTRESSLECSHELATLTGARASRYSAQPDAQFLEFP